MTDQVDRTVLPIRRPPFAGVANRALGGSQPDWGLIGHVKPPAGAPNVRSLLSLLSYLGSGEYRERYLGSRSRRPTCRNTTWRRHGSPRTGWPAVSW